MCGRRKATCSLHHAQVAGPSSGSAPRSDADPRCVVTFGGDAKCHACRRRKPDIASENSPCGISRLLQITSTARTDAERTSDLRSLCRWPVKRDPGTIIISNFDKHLALGAHHQPELRERQALEFRTFSARSDSSIELVGSKRNLRSTQAVISHEPHVHIPVNQSRDSVAPQWGRTRTPRTDG